MGKNAARQTADKAGHEGPITTGSPNVTTGGLPAARMGDSFTCKEHGTGVISGGSKTVTINGSTLVAVETPYWGPTVASMLTTVPSVKAALIVYQSGKNTIKGSLRAEKHANVDVSAIAHTLGGGGHKLASGFTIPGRIETTVDGGWRIV